MNADDYKRLHEQFMENNNGTTIEETFITILPVFSTTFIVVNLLTIIQPAMAALAFGLEFVVIVLSMILYQTVLHHRIWEINYTLLFIVATAVSKQLYNRLHLSPFVQIPSKRPAYITLIRGVINITTAVCILSVDFKCFPRKLAKTETFGFGLMDTGVGLYVYSNAIIAPELYKSDTESNRWLTMHKLRSIVFSCAPLFVLGLARFIVINEIDYQQHVSEYGVHWNFFLTLALTKIIGTLIVGILPKIEYCKYVAIGMLLLHEAMLQLGLEDYVISKTVARDTFINANREGFVSVLGYVSLYVSSVFIGTLLKIDDTSNEKRPKMRQTVNARPLAMKAIRILVLSLIFWKLTYALRDLFGVSRRLANMGYVLWVLAIATMMTAFFILLEIFYHFIAFDSAGAKRNTGNKSNNVDDDDDDISNNTCVPLLLNAINYNGLAFFLGANLLTGLVNILFQTLLIDAASAILLLTLYMLVLCAITGLLYSYRIQLKMW